MSTQLIERIRAIVDDGSMSRSGLARAAGLHANSLRDLDSPGWNPTAETLRKLENWLAHGSDLSPMATPEEIIAEARNGRMFILVDDDDRENEARNAKDKKCSAPTVQVGDITGKVRPKPGTNWRPKRKNGHGHGPTVCWKIVCDDRVAGWRSTRFANTHANTRQQKIIIATRITC